MALQRMPSGCFDVVQEEDELSDDDDKTDFVAPLITNHDAVGVLLHKDLSVVQADEETALAAAEYADELSLERRWSCEEEEDQFFVAFIVCIVHANILECQEVCTRICIILE
jgi:hypothetical protein